MGGDTLPLDFLDHAWRGRLAGLGATVALAKSSSELASFGAKRLEAWIEPATLRPASWTTRGSLRKLELVVESGSLNVAERLKSRVEGRLVDEGFKIEVVARQGVSSEGSIRLTASYETVSDHASSAVFEEIVPIDRTPEAIADQVVESFLTFQRTVGAAIDARSADFLLTALALTEGRSEFTVSEVTESLRATLATIRAFLPDRSVTIVESFDDHRAPRVIVA